MVPVEFFVLLVITQLKIGFASELYDNGHQLSEDVLSKYWGISDVDTVVGRLFQCKIPPEKDAFRGTIVEYDVEGEEPNTLPKWLVYHKSRSVLEGVATIADIGETRINVKAYDSKGKSVSDMFVIEVYPLENGNTNVKRKCRSGEEVMMLAIVIDENLNDITPTQRISVIQTLARALNIPTNTILFLPQLSTLDSSHASVRIDSKFNNTSANSSILTWQIGCNEIIWAEQLEVVRLVKKFVKSKAFVDILHLPVSQWRLIANFNPFRIRREVLSDNPSIDEPEESEEEDEDEEEEGGDDEEEEKISSSVSSSLQGQLSSVSANDTLPFQQSRIEDNSSWQLPLNDSKSDQYHPVSPSDAEENETELPELEYSIFDKQNETSSLGTTPSLDLSQTPFQCISCVSLEGNVSTEKPIAPTSVRFPPKVMRNLDPIVVRAGQLSKVRIPEDIFIDENGDGNTRNLTLRLVQKSEKCKPETVWIELDSETQTLLMLASSDSISHYDIILEAMNSANMSSNTSISVAVQYPPEERQINFEVSLHLHPRSENQRITTKLQLQLLDLIAQVYGDVNTENIMLRHVSCDPLIFTWTNNTLPLNSCDVSNIKKLLKVLVDVEGSSSVNSKVRSIISSLIDVEEVTWVGKSLCEGQIPAPRRTSVTVQFNPQIRNRIDNITARVGELLIYQIPEDAFYDPDAATRELRMTFTLLGQNSLSQDSWVQFDSKNFEIYGLPMNNDIGLESYTVTCYDNMEPENDQKAVRQTIELKVEPALRKPYNVEFSMTLNSSYTSFEDFNRVPMLRRTMVKKLSELFNDQDTSSIVVSGYAPGSLIIIWHNKTLPVDTCPEEEIETLRKVILTDKNELTERVNKVLGPEFQALSAMLAPIGNCEGGLTETHVTEIPIRTASQEIHSFFSKADFQYYFREYFVEVIMPVIIILLMMTFAGIIACILYRRQRRAKWNLNDETERRTYRNRGIPVIFQDELEERLETSNKSPIIMKEEKPPLPPPEYQKTLPMATTALLSDFDDPSYHQEMGSYSPRIAERSGRDKSNTPSYRKPPPYIPP